MLTEESVEYKKLERKRHLLMKKLEAAETGIREKERYLLELQREVEALREKYRKGYGEPEDGLSVYRTDSDRIRAVLDRIAEDGTLIRAKYSTKFAEKYYKIERGVFEGYAGSVLQMDAREFIDACVREGLLKTENGKAVYNSGRLRVYFLSKEAADALRGEKMLE